MNHLNSVTDHGHSEKLKPAAAACRYAEKNAANNNAKKVSPVRKNTSDPT